MSNDEIAAARAAIAEGDYAQARHHINNLSMDGAHAAEVEELTQLILWKENAAIEIGTQRIGWAIAVAALGYLILSFRTPAAWGNVLWGLTAFFALPLFVGVLAGNSVARSRDSQQKTARFWRAFGITAVTVVVYTLVGMTLSRAKMHSSDKAADFFIYFVVAATYSIAAGVVSGFAGSTFPIARRAS